MLSLDKVERYGQMVFENKELEDMRMDSCLCMKCGVLPDCRINEELRIITERDNIMMLTTRCPNYQEQPEPKKEPREIYRGSK